MCFLPSSVNVYDRLGVSESDPASYITSKGKLKHDVSFIFYVVRCLRLRYNLGEVEETRVL